MDRVASLLVTEGPLSGRRLEIGTVLVLGRGNADLIIEDTLISRRHALIRAAGDAFEIEDLDSLNGTWVNGSRIESPARLEPGDTVRVGATVIRVEHDRVARDEPPPPAPQLTPLPLGTPIAAPATPPAETSRCPECGGEVPSRARFCLYCGVALRREDASVVRPGPAPLPAPDVQLPIDTTLTPPGGYDELRPDHRPLRRRRRLDLARRAPPARRGEGADRRVREPHGARGRAVRRDDQAYMGDGIAAFFGMPTAHEDDPERAAHAALRDTRGRRRVRARHRGGVGGRRLQRPRRA